MFRRDFWRDWYNGEYTLVPLCIKKSQFLGQKQTPQGFCGDLFIPGGGRQFYGLLHTTTGNLQGNFKNLPPKAPFPSNHIRLQLNTSVQSPNFSAQNSLKN